MGFSFRITAVKGLRKKKKKVRSKADEFERPRRKRRAMVKPDSKSSGFEKIPEDLLMDILARLPPKLVTRLMCVSNRWYSLISSRPFTNLYLGSPSSAQRRRLFMAFVENQHSYVYVSASLPQDQSDTSVPLFDEDLSIRGMGGYFVNALRGLLCVRVERRLRICNLTTRQRVTLPIIRSRIVAEPNGDNIWNFFGHDPVHDAYKVLSIVWEVNKEEERIVRSEHQVFVLGPGASWRNTKSHTHPPPHRPYSKGISINGVLYYGAWMDQNTCVVVSFDLSSEEFNLIELPVEAGIVWHRWQTDLINYKGKLAIIEYSRLVSYKSVDLWVMENVAMRNWSKSTRVLPLSQMNFNHDDQLWMQGTSRCSEVRLGKTKPRPTQPRHYAIFDLDKNKITRSLETKRLYQLWSLGINKNMETNFWEHVDSIMYLET